MNYSRTEQETSIVWDENEKISRIYTASPMTIRKLDKLCKLCPMDYQQVWQETDDNGQITAAKYTTSSKFITFRKPTSEARREAARKAAYIRGFGSRPAESIPDIVDL